MAYALKIAGAKVLMTLPASLDVAVAACEKVDISRSCIFLLEGRHEQYKSIQDLIEMGKYCEPGPCYSIPSGMNNSQVCAFLNFSR